MNFRGRVQMTGSHTPKRQKDLIQLRLNSDWYGQPPCSGVSAPSPALLKSSHASRGVVGRVRLCSASRRMDSRRSHNVFHHLRSRGFHSSSSAFTADCFRHQRYNNYGLIARIDLLDRSDSDLPFFQQRSAVVEVTTQGRLVIALNRAGGCCVIDRLRLRLLRYCNVSSDDSIRSFHWNRFQSALITVSVHSADQQTALHCRSTPLSAISACPPLQSALFALSSLPILSSETLSYPGFVEFDDMNAAIVSHNHQQRDYKLWRLADYRAAFTLRGEGVRELKLCPGLLLLIRERQGSRQRLEIRSVDSGELLRVVEYRLQDEEAAATATEAGGEEAAAAFEYIELFNDQILIKERQQPLAIIDAGGQAVRRVPDFPALDSFLFLYEQRRFLTFSAAEIRSWRWEEVEDAGSGFEGLQLVRTAGYDNSSNLLCVSAAQELLISYGKETRRRRGRAINISRIDGGSLLGSISGWRRRVREEDLHWELEEDGESTEEHKEAVEVTETRRGRKRVWQEQADDAGSEEEKEAGPSSVAQRRRLDTTNDEDDLAAELLTERTERDVDDAERGEHDESEDDEDEEAVYEQVDSDEVAVDPRQLPAAAASDDGEEDSEYEWDEEAGKALQHVTALYYNEEVNEFITGDEQGWLSIWR